MAAREGGACRARGARGRQLQAREPRGGRGVRAPVPGAGARVRGGGQDPVPGGQRLPPRPPGGPALLLWRLCRALRPGGRPDGGVPQDGGLGRDHRAGLRRGGPGDPQGQEEGRLHHPQGPPGLRAPGPGAPRARRRALRAAPQRCGHRRRLHARLRGHQEQGPPGRGPAGPRARADLHQVHPVQLRGLRHRGPDGGRGCGPAVARGLRQVGGPQGADVGPPRTPQGARPALQGGGQAPGAHQRPRGVHRGGFYQGVPRPVPEQLHAAGGALDGGGQDLLPQGAPQGPLHRLGRLLPLPRQHRHGRALRRALPGAPRGLRAGRGGHLRGGRVRDGHGALGRAPLPPLRGAGGARAPRLTATCKASACARSRAARRPTSAHSSSLVGGGAVLQCDPLILRAQVPSRAPPALPGPI
mmetsp:Transcript_294/g.908  ORF Transcript_294/g.908 Transcript_294/m.908 type:complete len:414 (-) Transcript_294:91-1332(-)